MSAERRLIITDENTFKEYGCSPINLCDVGAREDIVEPWKRIDSLDPNLIRVVGFEPDPEECARLNANYGAKRKYYATALWSHVGDVEFYIAMSPSQSSAFEPDIETLTKIFPQKRWWGRRPRRRISVQAQTLDQVCRDDALAIDFMKIDTQGAEYEILAGGQEVALKDCFGVQAECWHFAAYKGLKLAHDVMRLMADNGFSVFAYAEGGSWTRGVDEAPKNDRAQPVQCDVLFLKNVDEIRMTEMTLERIVRWAALSELWGFANYGVELLQKWAADNGEDEAKIAPAVARLIENSKRNFEEFGKYGGFPSLR